ncbi:MAG TPA: XRE family transcriptional regulator [Flavobacteriia bacterium]|nr:XRE family transcriptional regulator [Flavobacteriia bacterium]
MAQIKDDILLKKIALCIKQIRKDAAITLDDFYVDTGIHLARIEQGKTNISIITLSAICNYFDISLKDFFSLLEGYR